MVYIDQHLVFSPPLLFLARDSVDKCDCHVVPTFLPCDSTCFHSDSRSGLTRPIALERFLIDKDTHYSVGKLTNRLGESEQQPVFLPENGLFVTHDPAMRLNLLSWGYRGIHILEPLLLTSSSFATSWTDIFASRIPLACQVFHYLQGHHS